MSDIVIIGGGIAGITCLETLLLEYNHDKPYKSITLISASKLIKRVVNYSKTGRNLEDFEVLTADARSLRDLDIPKGLEFRFLNGFARSIDDGKKKVHVQKRENGSLSEITISYDKLCLCGGASPKTLAPLRGVADQAKQHIFTVRDTTSVEELQKELASCEKVAIVGNGGIGLELADKITHCDLVWIVRDEYVGRPFLDSGACKFLLELSETGVSYPTQNQNKPAVFSSKPSFPCEALSGPALGPHWTQCLRLQGKHNDSRKMEIIYSTEVERISYIQDRCHSISILTGDNRNIDCDMIVSAIGVEPSHIDIVHGKLETSSKDRGILIDDQMRTSVKDIYAAGDIVSCERWPKNLLWFQMRLWTQARQMGYYCAKCILSHLLNEDPAIYFTFDCFSHTTKFFSTKLILLGRYNGQEMSYEELGKCEATVRINPHKEYIKVILKEDKVIGAVLAGETGLEETMENLICDQIDVGNIKHQLLDSTIDIEDYFD